MSRRPLVGPCDRWFLSWTIWLAHVEWGAEMRWLYSLTDPLDRWFGDDKASHWLGAAFAMCKARELLARWHFHVAVVSWLAIVFVIVLVEVVEYMRYDRWVAKGAPKPWPWMTDKVSLKDIAWGLLGAWMATL